MVAFVGLICVAKMSSLTLKWRRILFHLYVSKEPSMWKPLERYNYNKEEINQIAFSPKSYFLAAADDSGEVKIIDTRQQSLYKSLRAVHTSICSSVQFVSWRPWAAITGGLDAKLAIWDFSKGRAYNVINYGMPEVECKDLSSNVGQFYNPAFVHSVAVPDVNTLAGLNKICAVARGDGVVDVFEIEPEPATMKPKGSSQSRKASQLKARQSEIRGSNDDSSDQKEKRLRIDYSLGGHIASVSCVSFSLFRERGKFLISGGNDSTVKLWDLSKHFLDVQTSCDSHLSLNISLNKKVNWLCTTPSDSDNLIVCDTSKVLKVYTVL